MWDKGSYLRGLAPKQVLLKIIKIFLKERETKEPLRVRVLYGTFFKDCTLNEETWRTVLSKPKLYILPVTEIILR